MKLSSISTIGSRSTFEYSFEEGMLHIRFGKLKHPIRVNQGHIESVKIQVVNCKKEPIQRASFYNKPFWDECPNNRLSPYIAQLVLLNLI